MNSPYKKDIVAMMAEACHRRDINLEIYYSVVDWHHPAYPNIGRHHEIQTDPAKHDWDKYMDFLKGQIRELCSNYGSIHGIWWDMNVPEHKDPSVHEMIRKLQPSALINNRGFDDGDYSTPERDFDPEGANPDERAFKRPTEACQSVGANSWGYRRGEDYFSVKYFQRNIAKTLAMGGNYLLNAGPDANGEFPAESVSIIEELGKWYWKVKEALTAEPAPGLIENRRVLTTRKGENIYIVCPDDLDSGTLSLRPLDREPKELVLLNTGESVQFTLEPTVYEMAKGKALRLRKIPVNKLNSEVAVFKVI
jgi:alpha-L-fucosidase